VSDNLVSDYLVTGPRKLIQQLTNII